MKFLKRSTSFCYFIRCASQQALNKYKWQSVVGLEIHAQIATNSKLFSGASTDFSSPVNTNVSLFDAAIPGTLPVLNKGCVEAGVLTALALNCRVNPVSMFDRKHYFYADLPAGYQITQQRKPLANDGLLEFQVFTPGIHKKPYSKQSKIKQLQLEQDSGKSLHDDVDKRSLVDLNRAGIPLMELVFEPDLKDGEEAAALVKELCAILQRLHTCSCKMEEGALRVDANVSVNLPGQPLGTRTEVKNIGSIRAVAGAIKYEIQRQIELLESGKDITNETRAWDANSKSTIAMRDKEVVQDYRFMPEPNLPPLHLSMGILSEHMEGYVNVDSLRNKIPELPEESRIKLRENYALTVDQSIILVNEPILFSYFQEIVADPQQNVKLVANILTNELLTCINKAKLVLDDITVEHKTLGQLISFLQTNSINRLIFNRVLLEMLQENRNDPEEIISKNDWWLITDEEKLLDLCKDCVKNNPDVAIKYKSGKQKYFNALVGHIARVTDNKADMAAVARILKDVIKDDALFRQLTEGKRGN